jgi:hypothetical protein
MVTSAGAGRKAGGVRLLLAEIESLQRDQRTVEALGTAAARLGQPGAAAGIARLITGLAGSRPGSTRPRSENSFAVGGQC